MFPQRFNYRPDLTRPLTDGAVDTYNISVFLIYDRVDGNSSLSGTAVTDDQFTLSSSYRNHRVNRFDSRLHRLTYRLSFHDTRSHDVDLAVTFNIRDRSLTILRVTKGINDPAQISGTHWDI